MAGWDQTIIVGFVGRDPELRYTQQGVAVCDFSVAVTRKYGEKEVTRWFKVSAWRQLAELCAQYVKKGSQVMCVGSTNASAYTNKQGQPTASLELTADSVQFLSSGNAQQGGPEADGVDVPF